MVPSPERSCQAYLRCSGCPLLIMQRNTWCLAGIFKALRPSLIRRRTAQVAALLIGISLPQISLSHSLNCQPVLSGEAKNLAEYEGFEIAAIRIVRNNVFNTSDPDENNGLFRLMNSLHIKTNEGVIRGQLLFREGQLLDVDLLKESERMLRSRDYLADAEVTLESICERSVKLLVTTKDVWVTEPQISLSHQGGHSNAGFLLSEGNLLGSGNSLAIGYKKDGEKESRIYNFSSPHLANSRLLLRLGYEDSNHGQQMHFDLESPFYSLKTPKASGVSFFESTEEVIIRFRQKDINEYEQETEKIQLFIGRAQEVSSESTARFSAGLSKESNHFSALDKTTGLVPLSYDLQYPWLQYEFIENKYSVYRNLYLMHMKEDVQIGANFWARLGYGNADFGNDYEFIRFQSRVSDLVGIGDHHLMTFHLDMDARIYKHQEQLNESVINSSLEYHLLFGEFHRWYAQLEYNKGFNLLEHSELLLGALDGLRGYPDSYQRGDTRYRFTVEKRHVSKLHLFNLIRLGTVVFVDAGKAWGAGYQDQHLLANVGVGIRLSSSKARVGNVVHIDWAYPLVDRDLVPSHQWVLKASHQF